METPIVTVVGASGTLGGYVVKALIDKGSHVSAMVRGYGGDKAGHRNAGVVLSVAE